jgi:hypothetical protein
VAAARGVGVSSFWELVTFDSLAMDDVSRTFVARFGNYAQGHEALLQFVYANPDTPCALVRLCESE